MLAECRDNVDINIFLNIHGARLPCRSCNGHGLHTLHLMESCGCYWAA